MRGRSLWYAFMLTWLSAANTAKLPEDQAIANVSVTEQSVDDNIAAIFDASDSEAAEKDRLD